MHVFKSIFLHFMHNNYDYIVQIPVWYAMTFKNLYNRFYMYSSPHEYNMPSLVKIHSFNFIM